MNTQEYKFLKYLLSFTDEPLEITYSYWDGAGHRRVILASLLVLCDLLLLRYSFMQVIASQWPQSVSLTLIYTGAKR